MNIDYLVNNVFKEQIPFEINVLQKSSIDYFVPLLNTQTGKIRYISKYARVGIFELLRAANAIPFFFGKTITIEGQSYIDGEVGTVPQDLVDHAITLGARNIVLVDNFSLRTKIRKIILRLNAYMRPRNIRPALLRDVQLQDRPLVISDDIHFIHVRRDLLPARAMTRNRDLLTQTFDLGVHDALERAEELRTLFA